MKEVLVVEVKMSWREMLLKNFKQVAKNILVKRAGTVFAVSVLGAGISLFAQVLLARLMGVEQFGIYIYVLNWVLMVVLFSRLGLDNVLLRFIPTYTLDEHFGPLKGLLITAVQLVGITGLICGIGMGIVAWQVFGDEQANWLQCFLVGAFAVPVLSLLQLGRNILVGLKTPVSGLVSDLVLRPVFLVTFVLLWVSFGTVTLNATISMVCTFTATVMALIFAAYAIVSSVPKPVKSIQSIRRTKEWLKIAFPFWVASASEFALARADILVLGLYRPASEVGIYAAASTIAAALGFFIGAANYVIVPFFSEYYAAKKRLEAQRILTNSIHLVLMLVLPAATALVVFGDKILWLFGEEFIRGYSVLLILVCNPIIVGFTGSLGLLLGMSGQQQVFAKVLVSSGVIMVILNLILIPIYGMEGAAAASVLSLIWRCSCLSILTHRRLGIIPTALAPFFGRSSISTTISNNHDS